MAVHSAPVPTLAAIDMGEGEPAVEKLLVTLPRLDSNQQPFG
jgi:hypothetical protein